MARFNAYAPGQFSWVDLMTPDTDAAAKFYGALFGWRGDRVSNDDGGPYTMFHLDGDSVAGMGAMPDELQQMGVRPHWNSYVTVESVDATVQRALGLGAQVQKPAFDIVVGGTLVGRMAILVDPEGARISIWQPGNHRGSALANVPGTFCWNELCTRDVGAAVRFYEGLFGWKVKPGDAENGYREITLGARTNGGMLPWKKEMGDVPPHWGTYFTVADCDAAIAKVKSLGGNLLMGPVDIEPGRFAVVHDTQGAVFNVMYLKHPDGDPAGA